MDTRTGQIHNSLADALAAGVPEKHLVTGPLEALKELSTLVKRRNLAEGVRKRRARRNAKNAQAAASRKANRR